MDSLVCVVHTLILWGTEEKRQVLGQTQQGISRIGDGVHPVHRFPTETQADL